jgi:lipid-A-disaccharide synthase
VWALKSVLFSAGDASGELHAAALAEELRRREPELQLFGLGGPAMEKAGVELVVPQHELAVGGLFEVLTDLPRIVSAWRRMNRALVERQPDLVILVDSPDFNLPFAKRAKRRGVPVLYYVSPQVWAWRRGRVRRIAARVDRLAVIFPFEPEVYAGTGLAVDFVGHPLLDRLTPLATRDRAEVRRTLSLGPDRPLVLLLPGSRRNEVRRTLPLQLAAARALHALDPRVAFAIAVAPSIAREAIDEAIAAETLPALFDLTVIEGRTHEAIRAADVALAKPGTVTLEVALLGTPLVVTTRVNPFTAWLIRRLVHVSSYTMPNLIAGRAVVPEFLQEDAEPERIAEALAGLLAGPERETQLQALGALPEALGGGGAARRAADIAQEMALGAVRS